jgi:hypothetical protein
MEVSQDAMILERDEYSLGWVASEGIYTPENFTFQRLRACFKCTSVEALTDGSYQEWFVNGAGNGSDPDWGTSGMRCLSKWEAE